MPKAPSPRGARPRHDTRPRVLAALTSEPSTATEIAERAELPGRERAMHANRALLLLEADGLAVSETRRDRSDQGTMVGGRSDVPAGNGRMAASPLIVRSAAL